MVRQRLKVVFSVAWQEPIINWEYDDYFNIEDLNRVENNILEIYLLAKILRGEFNLEEINTSHDIKTIPFDDLLNKIERNINVLGGKLYKPKDWNLLESNWIYDMPFSYEDLNKWERNLLLLYRYVKGNIDNFRYCGMYTCGEEVI